MKSEMLSEKFGKYNKKGGVTQNLDFIEIDFIESVPFFLFNLLF